ncbi:MAG TPA: aminotransferase class V-fold PLP-dependent enzyme [Syntrophomonadaceae bacterium]|nr:aminotransferase class V-fold PLP-dependent enzyme [Syntrophomonadaceae bacterium]
MEDTINSEFDIKRFRCDVIGIETRVPTRKRKQQTFINLDNAASTPALQPVFRKVEKMLAWYSGVHRGTGFKSMTSTRIFDWCHQIIGEFVKADPDTHVVILVKNTTEAINKLSYRLNLTPADVVISTMMEHHSNDLPWRCQGRVEYAALDQEGRLDLGDVERKLRFWYPRVRLVTVCGASNVTGHVNDIYKLAALAHEYGSQILVDAAQLVPHRGLEMKPHYDPQHIDYLAFSGHKVYAPFGTGVLIGRRETFLRGKPEFSGGGTVRLVARKQVNWAELPDKEEAGSPNVVGAYALAETLRYLSKIGMERIAGYEEGLTKYLLNALKDIPGLTCYGIGPRVGVVSFNLRGMEHSLLGAILAHERGIGVRTGCFCAQPYVRFLLHQNEPEDLKTYENMGFWEMPGMVRISLGAYNTTAEIKELVKLLRDVAANRRSYKEDYILDPALGAFRPRSGDMLEPQWDFWQD